MNHIYSLLKKLTLSFSVVLASASLLTSCGSNGGQEAAGIRTVTKYKLTVQ